MNNGQIVGKTILIISPEPWDHVFVSKHHYAVHLSRTGNRVFFLNPPGNKLSSTPSSFDNLTIVDYKGFVKGLRFFPLMLSSLFMRSVWLSIERMLSVTFDIIWSFDNSVFYDFRVFPPKAIKISHIVDLNQDFNTRTASRTASICLCTTERIRQRLSLYNKKVFKINHGFNDVQSTVSTTLPGRNKCKAVYVGNLAMRFIDWETLYRTAASNSDVDFVFVGPGFEDVSASHQANAYKRATEGLPNVYAIGRVKAGDISSYLQGADILLVCYMERYHADQANPHKIMEYLGSGKVIVATKTEEFAEYRDIISMAGDNVELPELFSHVKDNLQFYNSDEFVQRRRGVASHNTYTKQIERIAQIIHDTQSH